MRRLPAWLHGPVRILGAIATTLALVLVVTLIWLIMTTSGLRTLIGTADHIAGDAFSVEHIDGRLFGTMHLTGISSQTPAAAVTVDKLVFGWTPGWLPALRLHIRTVQAEGVNVALPETPPDAPEETEPESGPLDISLPLRVVIADLSIRDVRVARGGDSLPGLDQLRLRAWMQGRRIAVEELHVEQPEFGSYTLAAKLDLPVGGIRIEELLLEGAGSVRANGAIPLDGSAGLDLSVEWDDLHWPAGATGDERLATSPHGSIEVAGTLNAPEIDGNLRIAPDATLRVDAAWRGDEGFNADIAWDNLADPLNPATPLWRSPGGRIQASGLPDDWRAGIDAEASLHLADAGTAEQTMGEGPLPGQLDIDLAVRANGGLERANLEQLEINALDGQLDASGDIQWAPTMEAALDLQLNGLDPGRVAPDFPGRINGKGSVQLTMPEDQPDARFRLALSNSRLRGYPLSLDVRGTFRDAVLALQQLRLRSGQSTLSASGRATPPFELRATLDSPDLAQLAPDVGGRAKLDARINGAMPGLRVRLDGELRDIDAAGQRIGALDLDADAALDGATEANIRLRGFTPAGSAEPLVDRLQLALGGRIDDHRLRLDASLPQGTTSMTLSGGAGLDARQWQGKLQELHLRPASEDVPSLSLRGAARLSAAPGNAELADFCLDDEAGAAICANASMRGEVLEADYSLVGFDLAVLRTLLPAGMQITGGASGEGNVRLRGSAIEQLDADLDIAEGALRVPERPELPFGPGQMSARAADDDQLAAELELAVAGGSLDGALRLQTGGAQALDGQLMLDLPEVDFLPLFTTEVREAAGSLNAQASIGGTLDNPELSANLRFDDGRLKLYTPGLDIRDIRARINTRDGQQVTLELGAKSDEGHLDISGEAALDASPIRARISVQGDNFQAANLPEVKAWISPDLEIAVSETIDVDGRLTVPRAIIEPEKFAGGDSGQAAHPDQVIVTDDGEPVDRGMPVNARVTVALGEEVSLEGYGLETRLEGSISVIEEPNRVTRARGALTLEDGRYDAYGQRLRIRRGRIVFAGGPVTDPGLDLEAVRTPSEDILVGVRVRGSIDQPEFQLFSEPGMPQTAQLSWLVLGRAPPSTGGQSEGDGDAMAAAALALGLSGGDWIAQKLGTSLGLDEISVGTNDGESGRQAQLTVGKYIGTRLYVAYGVSLFQPGQVFRMRYDIGRGFAIQTETGIESGGDLLYTHER